MVIQALARPRPGVGNVADMHRELRGSLGPGCQAQG